MSGLLRLLTGMDSGATASGVRPRFEWLGLPEGTTALLALGVAAALVVMIFMLYRRERGHTAPWRRWSACGLRVLILAVVAVILLQPSVAFDIERVEHGRLVFLVDRSASMSTEDRSMPRQLMESWARALGRDVAAEAPALQRHEVVRALLARGGGLLARCRLNNTVRLITFAEGAESGIISGASRRIMGAARMAADRAAHRHCRRHPRGPA